MLFKQNAMPEGLFLDVSVYTPSESFTPEQKSYVRRLFIALISNLFFTDLCIVLVFLFKDLLFALPGIYFAVKSVISIVNYSKIVMGEGLRSVMLVFDKLIRIIDYTGSRDIPYSFVTGGTMLEQGLILHFKDGSFFCVDSLSLLHSGNGPQIIAVLAQKLGKRFNNTFDSEEVKARAMEADGVRTEKRLEMLGSKTAEIIYEPDGKDCRDYCRLLLCTGREKGFVTYSVAFLAALLTAFPIISLITDFYIFETLAFIPLILLIGLLFVSKLGISAPAKKKFVAQIGKTGGKWAIYVHEKGICAIMNDSVELCCEWRGFREYRFDEKIGISLETHSGEVIFIPMDMMYDGTVDFILSCMEKVTEKG